MCAMPRRPAARCAASVLRRHRSRSNRIKTRPPARLIATGTGNITAMFACGYMEVLFKTSDSPLVREFDAALARRAGVHIVAFSVADAAAARGRLASTGFPVRDLVRMQRPVNTESGPDTAAFTIARVEASTMPEGRIQILTHHTEHTVWQPRWLSHPNGVCELIDVVIAVGDVEEGGGTVRAIHRPAGDTDGRRRADPARPRRRLPRQSSPGDRKIARGAGYVAAGRNRLRAWSAIAGRRRGSGRRRRSRMARYRRRHRRHVPDRIGRRRLVFCVERPESALPWRR